MAVKKKKKKERFSPGEQDDRSGTDRRQMSVKERGEKWRTVKQDFQC